MANKPLARIKQAFLDREKVQKSLDKKSLKVLARYGGSVRKTAQYSMRSRKKSAPKGQPPYAHGKKLLKRLLFYSLEKQRKTVVVGPVLLSETAKEGVPKLMEVGGTITRRVKDKSVKYVYTGHAFMKPASEVHIGKVASWYKS